MMQGTKKVDKGDFFFSHSHQDTRTPQDPHDQIAR